MGSNSKNELVRQISLCGQLIERKSVHLQEMGIDEEKLLSGLSVEEQETLAMLLGKLQVYWVEAHKKRHQNKNIKG